MFPLIDNPQYGQWYISVTCRKCNCMMLLFHDVNNGQGNANGVIHVTCPYCKRDQNLPVDHYQHEGRKNRCIEII